MSTRVKINKVPGILKELEKLSSKPYVKVGLPSDGEKTNVIREEGFTNLDIGFVNEFGSGSIPERSHIRAAYDENKKKLEVTTDKLINKILDGKTTVEDALDVLGLLKVSHIQKTIRGGIPPSVGRGGTPLIDTGQYVSSFTYVKVME